MNSSSKIGKRIVGTLLLVAQAAPPLTYAAWEAVPEVSLGVVANDNIARSVENEESGVRTVLDARVTLSNFNERGNFFLAPRFATDAYADSEQKDLSSDDVFLIGGGEYGWRTVATGFGVDYSETSVLRAEFENAVPEDPDIDDPAEGDTGRVGFAQQQRERLLLEGHLDFNLSVRDVLRLEYAGSEVAYSVIAGPFRSGYDHNQVALDFSRRIDDRHGFSVGASTARFEADSNSNTTTSVGLEAGYTRNLSQVWSLNLTAGISTVDYDFIESGTGNHVFGQAASPTVVVAMRKRNPRSTWNIGLDHVLTPSSNGYLTEQTRARVFLSEQFAPRLSGRFGFLISTFAPADDLNARDERDYARLQAAIDWEMSRTMLLTVGIDSIRQHFPNETSGSTDSNGIFFGVTYRGLSQQN